MKCSPEGLRNSNWFANSAFILAVAPAETPPLKLIVSTAFPFKAIPWFLAALLITKGLALAPQSIPLS